jgi:Calcineurin-like phosphoesterase.
MKKHSCFILGWLLFGCSLFAQKVELTDSNSFSMIVLPDPQTYSKFNYNQPLFSLMMEWIHQEKENLNIEAVLCTGDLVEYNDYLISSVNEGGQNGNQTSAEQWQFISSAFSRIDNRLPYISSLGNHDYGYKSAENRATKFGDYFTVERNSLNKKHLVSYFPNASGQATLENSAYTFSVPNWENILIITTEFHPRDETLHWAKELASSEKYKNHTVIFMTHSYLRVGGERFKTESYQIKNPNYGEDIWNKLIYPASNIRFVICGHDGEAGEKFERNVAFRTDKNSAGQGVHQMMFNAQALGGGWHGNGGDGWLRILEFMPDGKTVKVKTYSPLFGISPTTQKYAWRTEAYDQFDMTVD